MARFKLRSPVPLSSALAERDRMKICTALRLLAMLPLEVHKAQYPLTWQRFERLFWPPEDLAALRGLQKTYPEAVKTTAQLIVRDFPSEAGYVSLWCAAARFDDYRRDVLLRRDEPRLDRRALQLYADDARELVLWVGRARRLEMEYMICEAVLNVLQDMRSAGQILALIGDSAGTLDALRHADSQGRIGRTLDLALARTSAPTLPDQLKTPAAKHAFAWAMERVALGVLIGTAPERDRTTYNVDLRSFSAGFGGPSLQLKALTCGDCDGLVAEMIENASTPPPEI